MKWIGIVLLITWSAGLSGEGFPLYLGCANTYNYRPGDVRLDGTIVYHAEEFPLGRIDPSSSYHQNLKERWKRDEARLLQKYEKSGDFKDRSDYGVALMHNGKTRAALELFEELIRDHDDEYPIASNLGTAYELNGQNEQALKWIARSVELHEDSHEGTEWLHIRILEAKITSETDSILDISFGKKAKPVMPASLKNSPIEQERYIKALRYQLSERIQFVKPTDPVVARLLFELSNLVALKYNLRDAGQLTQLALVYSDPNPGEFYKLLKKRNSFYETQISDSFGAGIKRHKFMFIFIGLLILGLFSIPLKFFLDDAREAR